MTSELASERVDVATIDMAGGRQLRARLRRDQAGAPLGVALALGWASEPWRDCSSMQLPAEALTPLREALQRLESGRVP